jgi:hypothetical protein
MEVEPKIKKSTEFDLIRAEARQLSIWEAFGEESPPPPENISFSVNCIDDWPLVNQKPSGSSGITDLNPVIARANDLKVTVPPGYYTDIGKDGEEVAKGSFVGEQEWRLFIVLRKMALEYGGYQLDGSFALSFTLRELSRFYEKSTGKTVNHNLIRRRLEVLRTTVYQVKDKDQTGHFSLLRELFLSKKEDHGTKCYVMFDKMTEKTLTSGRGTLIDFDLVCQLPYMASWMYSKLEREGLRSGLESGRPYKLWLKDTLYRIGLGNSKKTTKVLKEELCSGLKTLITKGILEEFSFHDKFQKTRGRPMLLDSEISLVITKEFECRIRTKLMATKSLREGHSKKIKTLYLNNMGVSLVRLIPRQTADGWAGSYVSKENSNDDIPLVDFKTMGMAQNEDDEPALIDRAPNFFVESIKVLNRGEKGNRVISLINDRIRTYSSEEVRHSGTNPERTLHHRVGRASKENRPELEKIFDEVFGVNWREIAMEKFAKNGLKSR